MTNVVKSTHAAFPADGVDVHVSAEDASKHGVKPGDPAVVEVTVRPFKAEEWMAEGVDRVFESDEEEDEFLDRAPAPAE
jgi:hypothetical protein